MAKRKTKSLVKTEGTDLAILEAENFPVTQTASDEQMDSLAVGTEYLLSIKLYGATSAQCMKELIPPGHWGLRFDEEDILDLGKNIDLMFFARRPKALNWKDRGNVVACHDAGSDTFAYIREEAGIKDSDCAVGPAFLALERTTGKFVEYFCGNASAKSISKKMYGCLPLSAKQIKDRELADVVPHGPLSATLGVKLIQKKHTWHAPTFGKCSTPFTKLPPLEKMQLEINKFLAPDGGGEEVKDANTSDR